MQLEHGNGKIPKEYLYGRSTVEKQFRWKRVCITDVARAKLKVVTRFCGSKALCTATRPSYAAAFSLFHPACYHKAQQRYGTVWAAGPLFWPAPGNSRQARRAKACILAGSLRISAPRLARVSEFCERKRTAESSVLPNCRYAFIFGANTAKWELCTRSFREFRSLREKRA